MNKINGKQKGWPYGNGIREWKVKDGYGEKGEKNDGKKSEMKWRLGTERHSKGDNLSLPEAFNLQAVVDFMGTPTIGLYIHPGSEGHILQAKPQITLSFNLLDFTYACFWWDLKKLMSKSFNSMYTLEELARSIVDTFKLCLNCSINKQLSLNCWLTRLHCSALPCLQ